MKYTKLPRMIPQPPYAELLDKLFRELRLHEEKLVAHYSLGDLPSRPRLNQFSYEKDDFEKILPRVETYLRELNELPFINCNPIHYPFLVKCDDLLVLLRELSKPANVTQKLVEDHFQLSFAIPYSLIDPDNKVSELGLILLELREDIYLQCTEARVKSYLETYEKLLANDFYTKRLSVIEVWNEGHIAKIKALGEEIEFAMLLDT